MRSFHLSNFLLTLIVVNVPVLWLPSTTLHSFHILHIQWEERNGISFGANAFHTILRRIEIKGPTLSCLLPVDAMVLKMATATSYCREAVQELPSK